MDNSQKEEAFRSIASKTTQSSKRRFDDGEIHIEKAKENNDEIEVQEYLNAAGEEYGFATEIALKSNLIYDDFSQNERFNQEQTGIIQYEGNDVQCYAIGTPEWQKSLAADDRNLKTLTDPKEIKKLIDQCYVRVKRLITEKKDLLDKLASELFTKEVLLKDDIEKIIGPREPYFE